MIDRLASLTDTQVALRMQVVLGAVAILGYAVQEEHDRQVEQRARRRA